MVKLCCGIDESLFVHKQKYHHRGRQPEREIWGLNMIDVSVKPRKIVLKTVPDRKAEASFRIFQIFVMKGP